MKKKMVFATAVAGLLLMGTGSSFATLTVTYESSTDLSDRYTTGSISAYDTTGANMNGMQVTATLSNGLKDTAIWEADKGAVGSGWSLSMADLTGSTFNTPFVLNAFRDTDIVSLFIDATHGDTVFDVVFSSNSAYSTENSARGRSIATTALYSGVDITAYYSAPVTLIGDDPVGDLYSSLMLTFINTDSDPSTSGFISSSRLSFISDTDNIIAPVPEPATLLLFGTGLVGLIAYRRRSK